MTGQQFASWFREELRRREWSLSDFSRRASVDPSMVSRWARGERLPTPESCDVIADALLIDVDTVLAIAGHRPRDADTEIDAARERYITMLKRVRLNPEREFVLDAMLRGWIEWDRRDREPS